MRVSEHFNLEKSQFELDFVDIDTETDIPLFVDPYFLAQRTDRWSFEASQTVRSFFQQIVAFIHKGQTERAREIFRHLGEPNETCLGLSSGVPQGRGIGQLDADRIFESILESRAIQTGVLEHLEDCRIFIRNVDKDKMSDLTTNLIRKHLIDYTQQQCRLWGMPLRLNVPSGFYWSRKALGWKNEYVEMLLIDNRKILLVPKAIVSYTLEYTPAKYHQHYVLNFLQNEHLRLNSALVQISQRKDGSERRFVTKKSLKQTEAPITKEFLLEFTQRHPHVFEEFKNETAVKIQSLESEFVDGGGVGHVVDILVSRLKQIPSGSSHAADYHRTVTGILELLFYPDLMNPAVEKEVHQGRKRIDIVFDNAAKDGFFHDIHRVHNIPASFLFVECKNYSSDPTNPELDQLSGRFALNRGKCGLLLCRTIADMKKFLLRCADTYRDDRGLIIPIVDEDLHILLNEVRQGKREAVTKFLANRYREVAFA